MSFILDALGRVEALRGQKTAALSRVAVRPVSAAWPRRQMALRMVLAGLGACALAAGAWHLRHAALSRSMARPSPIAAVSDAASQVVASADIPTMASSAGAAHSALEPASAPRAAAARTSTKVRVAAVRRPAKFSPPTTLSQPLPTPSPVAAAAGARDKVPPPPPLAEPGDTALAASTPAPHNPLDDVQPLSVLPLELQALVQRMKVRVHVYAPVPRQRFVMVDSRQLREGDELSAGLQLQEITRVGMILQHKGTRVLAPAPLGR